MGSGTGQRAAHAPADTRFIALALPCMQQLERHARRLTGNRYDAEDLVQETFLRAYRSFHTFQDGTNMRAWLFRIMRNAWISAYRSRRLGPTEQLCGELTDGQLSIMSSSAPASLRSAEIEALEALQDNEITEALESIPAVNRMVVYYADVAGYQYREIASLMGTPVGTVMSRLARGRRRLRGLLVDVARERGVLRDAADATLTESVA
ncbi:MULTISPECIES: sigma-70 family RNA polymerase sigma factor [unclassified Mycolicibacterium]|uniref:sigma-70 family RNA polymerase sigma factor n=1 Tax=unclassified Mycolicibacterium TaxID=2636767 RepID=UPI0012DF6129|nr:MULTISPECIES: sigma-70 family RNA polymerase sigma factor [unclassified Mycolicibacterium]MUL82152.1 sigma-70 family RNA polymerase sigma factor [Mycolicibacterium sp. CBMA 329]MUL87918.1 sigma-70 family RNA polymerase sigma factor [Mycolicibacterium sp. CBMA 331]MUM02249.1 sigma-70 family RNA polymerase sigma factor [Mycolicibacterium sp. CBMA 334]MUM26466.1 sigma-70 family RNA polymerase sigma factor [Mycolicibacterium sp. CBMA 295]MUM38215.1 sigma-70 family RNA polymerase sigma factor [M